VPAPSASSSAPRAGPKTTDVAIEAVTHLEERIRGWEARRARRFPELVIPHRRRARRAEFERRFAACRRGGFSCGAPWSPTTTRVVGAPISASACTAPRPGWTFR
jgi:hypothetical protein